MNQKLTTETFVLKAKFIHGQQYDYSLVDYQKTAVPVTIICPIHGNFEQSPNNHLAGHGCRLCSKSVPNTATTIVDKFERVHGNQYDYSLVVYENIRTPVTIRCSLHGNFEQTPNNHLTGHGCPSCGNISVSNARLKSTSWFLERALDVHGERYDYSRAKYVGYQQLLIILCPDHGEFHQTPDNHLHGSGCPTCTHKVSRPSQEWLDHLGLPNTPEHREVTRLIPGRRYTVDGFDPDTKTVYEFHGDYWHGNPAVYDTDQINASNGKLFGTLYDETITKRLEFERAGYKYVEIWESDWREND